MSLKHKQQEFINMIKFVNQLKSNYDICIIPLLSLPLLYSRADNLTSFRRSLCEERTLRGMVHVTDRNMLNNKYQLVEKIIVKRTR